MRANASDQLDFPAIPAGVVDRLAKVCGLLGSDHDGERAAAAFQASRILRQHKLTWRELVEAAGPRQTPMAANQDAPDWRAQLAACQLYPGRMSPWERQFCATLARWRGQPSAKQLAVLARLFERLAS